eukprot:3028651-Rhodomonas_salina.1
MSGTELAYGPTRARGVRANRSWYWAPILLQTAAYPPTNCSLSSYVFYCGDRLCCYTMARQHAPWLRRRPYYLPSSSYAMPGTELAYGPDRRMNEYSSRSHSVRTIAPYASAVPLGA